MTLSPGAIDIELCMSRHTSCCIYYSTSNHKEECVRYSKGIGFFGLTKRILCLISFRKPLSLQRVFVIRLPLLCLMVFPWPLISECIVSRQILLVTYNLICVVPHASVSPLKWLGNQGVSNLPCPLSLLSSPQHYITSTSYSQITRKSLLYTRWRPRQRSQGKSLSFPANRWRTDHVQIRRCWDGDALNRTRKAPCDGA